MEVDEAVIDPAELEAAMQQDDDMDDQSDRPQFAALSAQQLTVRTMLLVSVLVALADLVARRMAHLNFDACLSPLTVTLLSKRTG